MARYAAARIVQAIPTIFIVSMMVFGLIRMAPGDPAAMRMGREAAKPENQPALEALREEMGLNDPIPVQYAYWLQDLAGGEFSEQLFLVLLALALHEGAVAENQILAAAVGFGDDARKALADELLGVLDAEHRDLAHGDEAADAGDLAFEAALVGAGDGHLDDLAGMNLVPIADADRGGWAGDFVDALIRIVTDDHHVELRADFGRGLELLELRDALIAAAAEIEEHVFLVEGDDDRGDARFGSELGGGRRVGRALHELID